MSTGRTITNTLAFGEVGARDMPRAIRFVDLPNQVRLFLDQRRRRGTTGRLTFESLGPSAMRLSVEADYPNLDASEVERLRPLIEQGYSRVGRMVESEV